MQMLQKQKEKMPGKRKPIGGELKKHGSMIFFPFYVYRPDLPLIHHRFFEV